MKKLFFVIFLISMLAACTPAQTAEPTSTQTPSPTATLTLPPSPTQGFPTLTPTQTPPPTTTPLPDTLPVFPMENYVMLYRQDGTLYFQDGENKPVELAQLIARNSELFQPDTLLSDDYQKAIFFRSDGNFYSVNTDGSGERIVIPKSWVEEIGADAKVWTVEFIPNTHMLFLLIRNCTLPRDDSPCPIFAFRVNTDTGEIRKIADLGDNYCSRGRCIRISPNGKMFAIGTNNDIKIYNLDGVLIHGDILPYTPYKESNLYPSLFWLPDSIGLIVALPDTFYTTQSHGDYTAHTMWRYDIDSDTAIQIYLNPPPWEQSFAVSPNGKWVAYGGYSDPTLYLGNLDSGTVSVFGRDSSHPSFFWSSNSQHLIAGWRVFTSLTKPYYETPQAVEWIDDKRFIVAVPLQTRTLIGEIVDGEVFFYEWGFQKGLFIPDYINRKYSNEQ